MVNMYRSAFLSFQVGGVEVVAVKFGNLAYVIAYSEEKGISHVELSMDGENTLVNILSSTKEFTEFVKDKVIPVVIKYFYIGAELN